MPENENFFEDDLAILQEFVEESNESLDSIESQFVALEKNPDDKELVNAIFRPIHSIKGNSAFLGLMNVRVLAHEMESVLDGVRKGELEPSETVVSGLLSGLDLLKAMLVRIQNKDAEVEDQAAFADVVEKVKSLKPRAEAEPDSVAPKPAPSSGPATKSEKTAAKPGKTDAKTDASPDRSVRIKERQIKEVQSLVGELDGIQQQLAGVSERITADPAGAKTEIDGMCGKFKDILVSIDEQFETMQKVPIRELLQRVPRIARETCAQTGKPVQLHVKGEGVLVSRSLVEGLEAPVMHMIRNAIDHGVESPQDRRKAGKTEQGSVWAEAAETDDQVTLRIADDGAGINFKELLLKAMKQNLVTNARSLTPKDISNLIFLPGLSTASKVSDLSGRGVGMDVVKHSVESLGGTIDVASKAGKGTEFILRFPKE